MLQRERGERGREREREREDERKREKEAGTGGELQRVRAGVDWHGEHMARSLHRFPMIPAFPTGTSKSATPNTFQMAPRQVAGLHTLTTRPACLPLVHAAMQYR